MKLSYLSILLLFLFPFFVFFMTRGIITHDEGYILFSSEKLINGLLPYRDFHFVYTPLSLFLTSLSFIVFKTSVLSSRILMIAIAMLSSLLIYKLVILSTKNKLYATIAVLIFAGWGPTHINFSWPVIYSIFTGLLTCYLLLKFLSTRIISFLVLAGLSSFLIFLAKQNFGIAFMIPIVTFFIIPNARSTKYIFPFLFGYIWGFIFFALYLLQTQSFAPFINDLYIFTLKRIIIDSKLTTQFIYQDSLLKMILRTTIYLLPAITSAAAFVLLLIRRRFHLLYLSLFVVVFYIAGIRPTTDYIHLVPLLSLIGIPIALFLRYNISSTIRLLILLFSFFIIILGFQTALFKGYYRWDSPLIDHNFFYNNSKVNIFINGKTNYEFTELTRIVDEKTKKGDYILVNSYSPMLYFVTQRQEPTKNNYLTAGVDPEGYYKEVLGNLVAKKVKVVILDHNSINSLPIKNFLLVNYHHEKTVQDFDIYFRN